MEFLAFLSRKSGIWGMIFKHCVLGLFPSCTFSKLLFETKGMILEIQGFLTEKNICALMMIMMHLIGISW